MGTRNSPAADAVHDAGRRRRIERHERDQGDTPRHLYEDFLPLVQNTVAKMPLLTHVVDIENPDLRLPALEQRTPEV
ncbi:hypothetical protein MRX96_009646 [Rhipicephalus microplus]